MTDLLSSGGDFVIERGDLVRTTAAEQVRQALESRFETIQGTRPWDLRSGVDYFGQILVRNPNLAAIAAFTKREILSVTGVAKLVSYTQTLTGRSLAITFRVEIASADAEVLEVQISGFDAERAKLTFVAHLV